MPRNLKVEKVWSPILAHQHILTLLKVDIGHVALMNGVDEAPQAGVKVVDNALAAGEWMPLDVTANHARLAPRSDDFGNALYAAKAFKGSEFPTDQPSPDPSHGNQQERCLPLDFENDLSALPFV